MVPEPTNWPEPVRRVFADFANLGYAVSMFRRFDPETDTAALFLGGRATIQDLYDFQDWVHGLEDRIRALEAEVLELEEVGREEDEDGEDW